MSAPTDGDAGRQYEPKDWRVTVPLPWEYDLTLSLAVGLRPWSRPVHLFRTRGHLSLRVNGIHANVDLSRYRYLKRIGAESRAAMEAQINGALPGCGEIRFDRDFDGDIASFGVVPVQAEGTLNGQRFHFRFRNNTARLDVYAPGSTGSDDDVIATTATVREVYPVADDPSNIYAGDFDSNADMVRVLLLLILDQEPVDPTKNPTYSQEMGVVFALMHLAETATAAGRDLEAEEACLASSTLEPKLLAQVRERWTTRWAERDAAAMAASEDRSA